MKDPIMLPEKWVAHQVIYDLVPDLHVILLGSRVHKLDLAHDMRPALGFHSNPSLDGSAMVCEGLIVLGYGFLVMGMSEHLS